VRVRYTDVNGGQLVWAAIHVTAANQEGTRWLIHRIQHTREGEERPFAEIQFDAAIVAQSP
jgi:hypothetical protein